MKRIQPQPLTASAFAPFGDVVEAPPDMGRAYFEGIANLRPHAPPRLWMLAKQPVAAPPLEIGKLERHAFSSQTFIPLEVGRWLIVVAPQGPDGRPQAERALAFEPSSRQGVSLKPGAWHAGLMVFDKPARLAVLQWLDGSPADEEALAVTPFMVDFLQGPA